jgi:NAD-reducing hydrogenase large subunit
LGRLNVIDKIDTPPAQAEFKLFGQINGGLPVEGSLYYPYARMMEVLYGVERAASYLMIRISCLRMFAQREAD